MNALRLVADAGLRRVVGGRVLVGGSPPRVLRLSAAGARLVESWCAGAPVAEHPTHRGLAVRLLDAGMAHPDYSGDTPTPSEVTVVVPVKDHGAALRTLLDTIGEVAEVLVVDDGSATPLPRAAVRHDTARGPAAARNAGWPLAGTGLVAFLDADTVPEPGWLEPLLRHFADPDVAVVAPRVRSMPGQSTVARYERTLSSLDFGAMPALVRPGSRVGYLPSAALVVRAEVLRAHGGFDERLRFGEDVDLVWRLVAAGARVRYEPASVVGHAPRSRWTAWLRQRFEYGTAAAPLAVRHGAAVAPARMSVWSAVSWAAVACGRPRLGMGVAAVSAALLVRRLAASGVPARESLRLAAGGHLGAGRLLADALLRTWTPLAVLAAGNRAGRRVLFAATARYLFDWCGDRPTVDPVRWYLARVVADAAYGAGVWWGCLRERTVVPLLPGII